MPSTISTHSDAALRELARQAAGASVQPAAGAEIGGLRVIERQSDQTPPVPERGVMVNGKFYTVQFPNDVQPGELVDVKASEKNGSIELLYVRRTEAPLSPKSSPESEILSALLKTLKVNRESAEVLRTLLSSFATGAENSQRRAALPEQAANFLRSIGITDAGDFSESEEVRKFFARGSSADAKKVIDTVLSRRRSELPGERALESARLFLRELRALKITPAPLENHRAAPEPPVPQRELLRELAPAFDRMIARAKEGGVSAQGVEAEYRRFKDLISLQGDAVKSVEQEIKILLGEGRAGSPITALLAMLERLEQQTNGDSSEIGKLLYGFARELRKGIEEALKTSMEGSALRKILEEGLRRLYETTGLKPLFERILSPEEPFIDVKIPDALRGSLRLIEAQMISVLNDPEFGSGTINAASEKGKALLVVLERIYKAAGEIIDHVEQHPSREGEVLASNAREVRESLRAVLTGAPTHEEAPKALRQTFETFLRAVSSQTDSGKINTLIGQQLHAHNGLSIESIEKLVHEIRRILSELSTQTGDESLRWLRESAGNLGVEFREELRRGGLPSDFKVLRQLLKQLAIELPATGTASENDLLEAVYRLAENLDQADAANPEKSTVIKESARPLMARLHRYLETHHPHSPEERALHTVDGEVLQRVSSAFAAQEALQRVLPMMKASSEPVFMLFPFIIGNLVHNAQIRYQGADGRDRNGASHGRDGSGENYARVHVLFTFSRLGEVLIDAAFRSGEILLNLGFENQAAASFVEARLAPLRKQFTAFGFHHSEITVAPLDRARAHSLVNGTSIERMLSASNAIAG